MIELYPHQNQALHMTSGKNRVAYYLDMGLGKTFVGSEKMKQLGATVNLVVCQKSKVEDWVNHFKEHHPEYATFDLTNKVNYGGFFNSVQTVGLCSIVGVINYDLTFRRPELADLKDFTLMLDESSLVQNEMSKRSKFILKKLKPKNVILLSGTPTGGKYERLWSQCQLLGWNISKKLFWDTYVRYHIQDFNGFPQRIVDGYKNVERLKRKLREYGAVFMKSEEVFDLPEQISTTVYVPTTPEYKKFKKHSIIEISRKELVGDTTLTKMLYERQLCGQYNERKLTAFSELLESTDDRLIVFYSFTEEFNRLSAICKAANRKMSVVNGESKDLSAYENSEDSVTFIQYQAGAMGLNLQKSNKIVYFTPPLSSELFEQSKKRIHRIGQDKTCFYYYMTCKGSVEERIYKTLAMRKDYTEKLFEEE